MNIQPLPASWRLRALVLSDVELPGEWFRDEELREALRFPHARRREEWLSTRVAAKELALQRGLCSSPRQCSVERPLLVIDAMPAAYVALSHSRRFAAAAVDDHPVGIDVEALREIDEATARFFLTDAEQEALRRSKVRHRLLHFWSAKEAAWKRLNGAVATLKQVPLTFIGESEGGLMFDLVETVAIDGAILALTRPIS